MWIVYWCAGLIASLCLSHASAQTLGIAPAMAATVLSATASDLTTQPVMAMREHVPLNHSIQTISGEPALFTQLFDPLKAYKMSADDAMWLHFRVRLDDKPSPTGWILSLSKSYIDRIEFYYKDALGVWQRQVAGDHIPHMQWPLRGLRPQFVLPVMAQGEHDLYVKVQSAVPLHFSMDIQRTDAVYQDTQNTLLWTGLLLGAALLMLAYACFKAITLRRAVYGWYALFVVLSSLGTISHLGLSSRLFWPNATWWPDYSVYALIMAAIIVQLQFCRAMFLSTGHEPLLQRAVTGIIILSVMAICLYFFTGNAVHRQIYYALVSCVCIAVSFFLALRALRQPGCVALLCFIANLPLLFTLGTASIDSFGVTPINSIPLDATIYSQIYELIVLAIALQLHARSQQTEVIRESVMAGLDPLTGFVTSRLFEDTAEQLWEEGRQQKHDMVVAYVEAKFDTKQPVQHIVRLLRTVVRDNDMVAHVDNNLFAILQPGKSVGDELSNRLSRLVVLGQMTDNNHADASQVYFRIVASSLKSFTGEWHELESALRQKLRLPTGWDRRRIRFVAKNNAEKFDALWMRAVAVSADTATLAKRA